MSRPASESERKKPNVSRQDTNLPPQCINECTHWAQNRSNQQTQMHMHKAKQDYKHMHKAGLQAHTQMHSNQMQRHMHKCTWTKPSALQAQSKANSRPGKTERCCLQDYMMLTSVLQRQWSSPTNHKFHIKRLAINFRIPQRLFDINLPNWRSEAMLFAPFEKRCVGRFQFELPIAALEKPTK